MVGMTYKSNFAWNGPKLVGNAKVGARAGVKKAGQRLGALSAPLVPVDSGALRASRKVSGVNAEPIALVSYNTKYAVIQHENESFHHDGGQAHFLSIPLEENAAELNAIIATEVRNAISRG